MFSVSTIFIFHFSFATSTLHSFPTRRSSDLELKGKNPCENLSRERRFVRRIASSLNKANHTECNSMASAPNHESPRRRSEEHTSELQSRGHLVCRLLLEKKKRPHTIRTNTQI